MVTDFTSRELSRPYAGTMMEITSNASYVKIWAHRPRFNMDGKLQHGRGSVLTNRFPKEDTQGLLLHAGNGFFPWHPDSEPDLTAFPGNSKKDLDTRKLVLKAFEFYEEKYGTDSEPVAEEIPEPEPEVKLPEPIFEEPAEQTRIICGIDECTYEPKSRNSNNKVLSEKVRKHSLTLHQKSHAKVATA